jgi:zinc protease
MTERRAAAAALGLALALTGAAATVPAGAQAGDRNTAKAPVASQPSSGAASPASAGLPPFEVVSLPSSSPLIAVRVMFKVGSIHDPVGKEGLAALTAAMVASAATTSHSYNGLLEALYPLAAEIRGNVDREVAVFSGTVDRDALRDYTALFEEALLHPAFDESDFRRNKEQQLSTLTNTLRAANDELLGLEALQDAIFAGHPYGHPPAGTVGGLKSITLDDVRRFYQEHYTRANLMLGVAGGYPQEWLAALERDLAVLPAGRAGARELPAPRRASGRRITIIDKGTDSVGIHFGYPLPITRRDPDYYALMVANSALGEHRTFNGRLMVDLRGARGLNYGDYSYIEHWHLPPFTSHPHPGVPRRQQYFSVWVRPVVPADAQFALRAALWEVGRLRDSGLSEEEFENTRNFVLHYSKLWVQDLSLRLGFAMDSRFYGMPYYIDEIERRLRQLTRDDVNRAIRAYLSPDHFDAVIVSAKGGELKSLLARDEPSPKKYNSQVAPEVAKADQAIVPLKLHADSITVVPVTQMFEK